MTLVSVKSFQPDHGAFQPPCDEDYDGGGEEFGPRIFERGGQVMEPRQLNESLVQPDRCSAVVEELRDVELRDEHEPNQPGKEAERNATRACASPGHDSPNRMTRSRRLDLKQVKAL